MVAGGGQIHSIAVLPFINSSADPNVEYVADGVTDGVISSLSRVPALKVMARSTVFSYKGHEVNAQKVGKELNVDALLMGKISQRGEAAQVGQPSVSQSVAPAQVQLPQLPEAG